MPVYSPPALNAVNFSLTARTPDSVAPYGMALTSYTVPALNAVNFALASYTLPVYNTADFELGVEPTVVNPDVGTITLTGYSPTISIVSPLIAGLGVITLTGYSPTVSAIEDVAPENPLRISLNSRYTSRPKAPPKKYHTFTKFGKRK